MMSALRKRAEGGRAAPCLKAISALSSRPVYGKIKALPPHWSQATGVACLPAGASVGARAARRQELNIINDDCNTISAIAATVTIEINKTRPTS